LLLAHRWLKKAGALWLLLSAALSLALFA